MGKIKKILENELVGGTQTTDVYPVTSVKAVYDGNNERLDHILNRRGVVNISTNYNDDHIAEVLTLAQAINKVPSSDRVLGFTGSVLTADGWKTYRFIGDSLTQWGEVEYWSTIIESTNLAQGLGDDNTKAISQYAAKELDTHAAVKVLIGNDMNGVTSKYKGVLKGHTYRVYLRDTVWEYPQEINTQYSFFEIYYRDSSAEGGFRILYRATAENNKLQEYYDCKIPDDFQPEGLYIYCRAVKGTELVFLIEDLENTTQNIDFQRKSMNTYIVGKGTIYSSTRFRGQPGRLYKISLPRTEWGISDNTQGSIFYLGYTTDGVEHQVVSSTDFTDIQSDYYFQFLEGYDYFNIGGKASVGEDIFVLIEDVTDIHKNGIVTSKSGLKGEQIPILNSGYLIPQNILDPNSVRLNLRFLHTIVECKAGDLFSIQGKGGTSEALLMRFYDMSGNYLTETAVGADYSEKEFLFMCYQDGYLCINVNSQFPYNLIKLDNNIQEESIDVTPHIRWNAGYVQYISGAVHPESQINSYTAYIPTFGYDRIKLLVPTTNSSNLSIGLAFYDKNRNYIVGYQGLINQSEVGCVEQEYAIPENAAVFRTTLRNEYLELQNIVLSRSKIDVESVNPDDCVTIIDAYASVSTNELVSSTGNKTLVFQVKKGDTMSVKSLQHPDSGVFAFTKTIPLIGDHVDIVKPGLDSKSLRPYIITAQEDGYILFTYLWKRDTPYEDLVIKSPHTYSSGKIDSLMKRASPYSDARNNFQFVSLSAEDATDKANWTANDIIENIYEPMRAAHPEYITRKSLGKDESGLYDIWCYEFNSSVDEWFDLSRNTNFYGTSVHVPLTNGLASNQCEIRKAFFEEYVTEDYVNLYLDSTFPVRKPTLVISKEVVYYNGEEWFKFTCDSDIKIITSTSSGGQGFTIYWTKKVNTFDQHAVIMAGAHGNESAGVLGVALALQYLVEHHNENPSLNYIYNSVKLSVVPCLNMWGMNQSPHVRTNVNGINLNRYENDLTAEQRVITDFVGGIKDEISLFIDFHTAEWWLNYGYVYSINSKHSRLYPAISATANYLCKHWFPNTPAYNWNIGTSSTTVNTNAKYMENVFGLDSATIEFAGYDLMYYGSCDRWDAKYMTYCVENYINFLMAVCNLRLKYNSKNIIDEPFFEHTTMS